MKLLKLWLRACGLFLLSGICLGLFFTGCSVVHRVGRMLVPPSPSIERIR